jgi:cysteinyl-tRNA synthetase
MLKIYNSYTNCKEDFTSLAKNQVKMYVCGPTVYNEIHVGNARCVLTFDLLYRVLKKSYNDVIYVRNITDIDDKIINRAIKENKSRQEVAQYWENSFQENCAKLRTLKPTYEPRATDTIKEIQVAISELLENGFAYIENNHVLFKVEQLKEYGALSKQSSVQ